MTDVPDHVIEAWKNAEPRMRPTIRAVLAALRPEDAHLVPAWAEDEMRILGLSQRVADLLVERDEAHAEAERLKAQVAEYENCITWGVTCKGCTTLLDRLYKTETENEHETDRLKAEVESLKANTKILESSLAAVTEACRKQRAKSRGESLVDADYRIALEHEVAQLKAENERLKEDHRNCVRPASLADVQADIYRRDPDARQRATDKAAEAWRAFRLTFTDATPDARQRATDKAAETDD